MQAFTFRMQLLGPIFKNAKKIFHLTSRYNEFSE